MKRSMLLYCLCLACFCHAETFVVTSPDGTLSAKVDVGDSLAYSISKNGETIVADSPLGFAYKDGRTCRGGWKVKSSKTCGGVEAWKPVVANRHGEISIAYNELEIELENLGYDLGLGDIKVVFRAADDGVAFRFALPNGELTAEDTRFNVPNTATAWVAEYARPYTSSQEGEFYPRPVVGVTSSTVAGMPFLMKYRDDLWVMIAEAHIENYPGFYVGGARCGLNKTAPGIHPLCVKLSPLPGERTDDKGVKARSDAPINTSWRVVMVANRPGRFMETDFIQSLNPPCAISDTSWIKPGVSAWDHWWSGEIKATPEVIREYIDFAAREGWPYMIIDWGWYGAHGKSTSDITKPVIDIPALAKYASEKGVKCWLWCYWTDVNRNDKYLEAFKLFNSWGIAGVKIDFMDRDDQWMVNWYRKIVKCAAENRLMVDFHGAYKPDGIERTYPNLLTREGVRGAEYYKVGDNPVYPTPEHNTTLPFTRMAQGPMDYTPGGFLNVTAANFRKQVPALVANTRAAELAKFVIYESPLQVFADHPTNVVGKAGESFLKAFPTTWDDTRCLAGYPGEFVIVARRRGADWYLGGLGNSAATDLEVDLSFLGDGEWNAAIWRDSPDSVLNPSIIAVEDRTIDVATKTLKVSCAPAGGFAAIVKPQSVVGNPAAHP